MKRYFTLALLFMFFVFGGVAQVDSLILPFNATDLTEMQKKLNPDYLAYPLALASQVPEINCNQTCMEYVDLGLSVLWATCNVGAEYPEDYGDYIPWGEAYAKSIYSYETYKYCKGSIITMTKYCNDSEYGYNGFVDDKTILDPEDDAATIRWGGSWRMPTETEFLELIEQCTWSLVTQNGVKGYKVTGKNGNAIFLPAAGTTNEEEFVNIGIGGYYWTSSLSSLMPYDARYMYFYKSNSVVMQSRNRNYGHSVRPVCPKKQEHEWVDLGLSVKWATCNVGAEKPEDYGDYFAWGETEPKENYDWTTYKYCKGTNKTMTKYCNNSSYGYNGFTDNKTVLDPEDDAATANWGGSWRMPTEAELWELRDQCIWTDTSQNGVNGYKVIGPNGNYIFLPVAGYYWNDGSLFKGEGWIGNYRSSSLIVGDPTCAYGINFYSNSSSDIGIFYADRQYGMSVRPVCP